MKKDPINYIVGIEDSLLAEFLYCWLYYEKPCTFLIMKAKTEGLTAIKVVVDSDETADFLLKVKSKTGCKLYQK